jgi:hypothetical protein
MKKFLAMADAASALAVAAPASAQQWQNINQRQANLDQRIDVGVRNGSLTRAEAARLRSDFNSLARREAQYRRNGLSVAERRDLDRRFDALSARIRYERNDRQDRDRGGMQQLDARQRAIFNRIEAGERTGRLSSREAYRLRGEFAEISRLQGRYMPGGLSRTEARDLHARLDRLEANVHASLNNRSRG